MIVRFRDISLSASSQSWWQEYHWPIVGALLIHCGLLFLLLFSFHPDNQQSFKMPTPSYVKAVVMEMPKPAVKKPKPVVKKPKPAVKKPRPVVKKPTPAVSKPKQPKTTPAVKKPAIDYDKLIAEQEASMREQMREQAKQQAADQQSAQIAQQDESRYQSEVAEYTGAIRVKIANVWKIPAAASSGWSATVKVFMIPGGEVVDVEVIESSGNSAYDRSIENAVWKAERLPVPSDPTLFDRYFRRINLRFSPEDNFL